MFKYIISLTIAGAASTTIFVSIQLLKIEALEQKILIKQFDFFENWLIIFTICCLHVVIIGIPIIILFCIFRLQGWWASAAGGFLIGATPTVVGVADKLYNLDIYFIERVLEVGFVGMVGGLVGWGFWVNFSFVNAFIERCRRN